MQKNSVLIIGAGPAGLTAALQLKRVGISVLLLEGTYLGGLLYNANLVENYPGFPHGVKGPKLLRLFQKQAEHIGVEILFEKVISLDYNGKNFVATTSKNEYSAEVAIIASGTKAREFDDYLIASEAKHRVFYEVRDLLNLANKEIIIVGAGDASFDYALNLARQNKVKILNRGTKTKALGLLQTRVTENEHIVYVKNASLKRVTLADDACLRVSVAFQHGVEELHASLVLGALGRIPNLDFLTPEIQSKEKELMARNILYFIGDVQNGIFRQTAISVGDGLRAAMEIENFFKEK